MKATPVNSDEGDSVSAFGTEASTEGIEISDLTIDCNMSRQPRPNGAQGQPALIATKAIDLSQASNVRIRRVRVINWGTHTPLEVPDSKEDFPIYLVGPYGGSVNCENVVEDCIVEQPDLSNAREATMLNCSAHSGNPNVFCTVRNNYLNADFTTGAPPLPIRVVTIDGTSITTQWPHCMQGGGGLTGPKPDEVYLSGYPNGSDNKRIAVSSVTDYRTLVLAEAPAAIPTGAAIMAQRYVPKAMIATAISRVGNSVTITTPEPHLRRAGTNADTIRVSGVVSNGTTDNLYNGSFKVLAVTSTTLTYETDLVPAHDPDAGNSVIWLDRWPSQQVIIKNGGLNAASRTVEFCAPHYKAKDDWILISGTGSAWDGYRRVEELINSKTVKIAGLSGSPSPDYQTAEVENLLQGVTDTGGYGARVYGNRLVGMRRGGPYHDSGPPDSTRTKDLLTFFNYYFFVFRGQESSIGEVPSGIVADYREGRNITYGNIIDVQPFSAGAWNHAVPAGILFQVTSLQENLFPYFEALILRDNVIRFVVASSPSMNGFNQFGISAQAALNLIAEENLIAYPAASQPLLIVPVANKTQFQKFFNNLGPNGAVMLGKDKTTGVHESEPASYAEDVLWVWRRKCDLF